MRTSIPTTTRRSGMHVKGLIGTSEGAYYMKQVLFGDVWH